MSFEPKYFIDISKELRNGNTEAHYRTLINRAYYGVFGHIRKRWPTYISDGSVHKDLIRSLKNSPHINDKKIGKRLETLFKKRKDADYKYSSEIKKTSCNFAINEAEDIINLFDKKF